MKTVPGLRFAAAIAVACLALVAPGFAQYTTVSTTYLGGSANPAASATMYWQTVYAARVGTSSGQLLGMPVSNQVTAGAGSVALPDASLTHPVTCYAVTAIDNLSGAIILGEGLLADGHVKPGGPYGCVQPAGSSWNFDSYIPPVMGVPVVNGVPYFFWQGAWTNAFAYQIGDAVYYNGASYINTLALNTNTPPGTGWSLMAVAGANGTNCASGGSPSTCYFNGTLQAQNVNGFIYVDGTFYAMTGPGLQAALSAAGTGGAYATTTVFLGAGTVVTNVSINVPPNVVLKGAGQQNARIQAGASFPPATPLVQLGTADGINWPNTINGTRVESLTLDCNSKTTCTGGYTRNANENSGFYDVTAHAAPQYGFWFDGTHTADTNNPTPGHWILRDATICCSTDVAGVYVDAAGPGRIQNVTVNTPSSPSAIEALGTGSNACFDLQVVGLHTEGAGSTDGIYAHASGACGTSNRLAVWGYEATGSPTNLIHIGSTFVNVVDIDGNIESNGTNAIKNDFSTSTITVASLAKSFYHFATGGSNVLGLGVAFDEYWHDQNGFRFNGHGLYLFAPTGQQNPIVTQAGSAGTWKYGPDSASGDDSVSWFSSTYGPSHSFHNVLQCKSDGSCQVDGAFTPGQIIGTGGTVMDTSGNVGAGGAATIIYRCSVAGTLRIGQYTTVAADCGTAVDSGIRSK